MFYIDMEIRCIQFNLGQWIHLLAMYFQWPIQILDNIGAIGSLGPFLWGQDGGYYTILP